MEEKEFKTFEKDALVFMRTLGFSPQAYYPYDHCSDISGTISPQAPFKIPTRAMVEVVRGAPTSDSVEGFHQLAKNSLADRLIMICSERLEQLPIRPLIERLHIEYFDKKDIAAELSQRSIDQKAVQAYTKIYELFGPFALAQRLPEIARQGIPAEMKKDAQDLNLEPWQLFEQAVFSIFHFCFSFPTRKLGEDCLFEHEPEGVVVIGESDSRYALIYECKSAKESYSMSSDHELRYRDYIKEKRQSVQVLENSPLRYFVIIAPSFSGDIQDRRQKIFDDTGIWTVFMSATVLSSFGEWASRLPNDIKKLVNLKDIFKLDELLVSENTIAQYTKSFESSTKRRY
jgi:hypothetical protein